MPVWEVRRCRPSKLFLGRLNELVACVNVRRRGFDVKKLLASLPEASPVK